MSGRDAQDPVFGSDLIWDDFQMFYQKISRVNFPMEYKIVRETEILAPTWLNIHYVKGEDRPPDHHVDESGNQTYLYWASWQRRPVHVVEFKELHPSYTYSRRVIFIDRETMRILNVECFDQSNRLWRSVMQDQTLEDDTGCYTENTPQFIDHLNQHRTILDCRGIPNPKWVGPQYSDMKFLIRKAR